MPGFTYEQLTRVPHVMRVIEKYNAPGSVISRRYGLNFGATPGQRLPHRTGVYDIFNPTRGMPIGRAPMVGPARVSRKPIGQQIITVPRFYEALTIEDEYVFRNRPLGGPYGVVDPSGASYIAKQIGHEVAKFNNLHEFMAISMFRGGYAYTQIGDDLFPIRKEDAAANDIVVNTLVDSSHRVQLALGAGGANLINTTWANAAADIVQQLFSLDKVHAARHGAPLRHIWGNATTLAPLFNNTKLQAVGGSVYRIFDAMSPRTEIDPNQRWPDTGVDIVFRALPQWTFHIYNQVHILGQVSESFAAQTDPANISYMIPDNEVIITPEPGDWCELVAGSEPMQWSILDAPEVVSGFGTGRDRAIDPPRYDLKFLSNACPVLTQERAVYNPTVIF